MIDGAIWKQTFVYLMLPMSLAIVHSIVGIMGLKELLSIDLQSILIGSLLVAIHLRRLFLRRLFKGEKQPCLKIVSLANKMRRFIKPGKRLCWTARNFSQSKERGVDNCKKGIGDTR
ncbi:hypothetical protein [Planococcus massiliensis]|uniref:hypothetical protein n=1 Tax=Planococcus massiliensis TaxID=1499687 RepID=UPI0006960A23|nr:hypothetical protein [Planococcus massiliensis]